MNPILKNILAVVIGIVVGAFVNSSIIQYGPLLIPYPEDIDSNSIESINAAMSNFKFKHFLTPFFAHALGTLVGAFLTAKIAATHKMRLAMVIGIVFLLGGISMVVLLPNSPMLFNITDLAMAYIPMAWIGARLAGTK